MRKENKSILPRDKNHSLPEDKEIYGYACLSFL
jgi:hypothetical protein